MPQTRNGFDLAEVISAIQKEIRRANEREAMECCMELVPYFEAYLWKRLLIISMEDIGIGCPATHTLVRALRDTYFECREEGKDGGARLALANAVLLMCRSEKTRIADHLQCVVSANREKEGVLPVLPDYAFDKHTGKGKRMGRGVDHWLKEGCKLAGKSSEPDPYEAEATQFWRGGWRGVKWGARKKDGGQNNLFAATEEPADQD
jgi:replication-associated recombination protein RarA